ncbi:MAG: hypothetical protein COW32_07760 [Candidatus Aquicultor secundus]|uniref:Carboxymuconolactone decarboxylase family protein n=1 Tax=Candidatus Aquicultor secundus TaxID=1973895 RepID=A0A2M7T6D2_9ACTN|nr:hypothetical protein [Candidatus Aquicultor secundus]NCO66905.1 hypothetical protein [Solirubrobacter sp.]OIO88516.1 MAG: hypothetical protein AUK32_01390 [Candidatus Aquicultor secundus]PIU27454.1 MAG: hypothetical protein COT10_03365 [Candidatus Aquicultor secundus]PIW21846.1 MAG: hypothetical protein COW32_07760 [Candidatus Aquicultor secundus]PIX52180.1 MAG: hypothetical protein COZ51_05530 [Candidatus Aquicultor secundus]
MSENMQPTIDEILKRIEAEVGAVPETMTHLASLKPEMVREHVRSKQFAFSQESIPEKYRQLITIAAVAGAGVPTCIATQVRSRFAKASPLMRSSMRSY